MQALPADNETRLPRAVMRQVAAINARSLSPIESETDLAPVASTAQPSTSGAPTADPQPAAPQSSNPPADPRHSDPAYWKHRFEVVNGILAKERESRATEVEGLHQRIVGLQGDMQTLRATAPQPKVDLGKYFTPEQIEEFGEDQALAIAQSADKVAREQVQAAIDREVKPLKEKQERDQKRQVDDAQDKFYTTLDELVVDWRVVDKTQPWLAWLAEPDEGTGLERQQILDAHITKANAPAIAAMFEAYRAATAVPIPQITPHGGGAGPNGDPPPVNPTGLLPLTQAEIKTFYKRAALNKVTDQERAEFEARLKR